MLPSNLIQGDFIRCFALKVSTLLFGNIHVLKNSFVDSCHARRCCLSQEIHMASTTNSSVKNGAVVGMQFSTYVSSRRVPGNLAVCRFFKNWDLFDLTWYFVKMALVVCWNETNKRVLMSFLVHYQIYKQSDRIQEGFGEQGLPGINTQYYKVMGFICSEWRLSATLNELIASLTKEVTRV